MTELPQSRARVRLWGDVGVWAADGTPIPLAGRRARALIALLAMSAEQVSRDRLAVFLWDAPERQARASLRQLLYSLKGLAQTPGAILRIEPARVWLDPDLIVVDVVEIERLDPQALLRAMPSPDVEFAAGLDGITETLDEWLQLQRSASEIKLTRAVASAGTALLDAGQARTARALADAASTRDAFDETPVQLGMRADAALGDPAGLTRRLKRLEASLLAELGIAPSAATLALAATLTAVEQQPTPALAPSPADDRCPDREQDSGVTRRPRHRRTVPIVAAAVALLAGLIGLGLSRGRTVPAIVDPPERVSAARMVAQARRFDHLRTSAGYARAATLLRRAIALDPSYADAWAELGLATRWPAIWAEQRHPGALARAREDALRYEAEALRLNPGYARALAIKGVIMGEETGTRLLEAAVRADAHDPDIWLWAGEDRWSFALYPSAVEAFRRAATLDPAWPQAASALIMHLDELNEAAAADAALARFAATCRDRYAVAVLAGDLALQRGQLARAARHYADALATGRRETAAAVTGLVFVARAIGDPAAIRLLTKGTPEFARMYAPFYNAKAAPERAEADGEGWWRGVFVPEEARSLLNANRADLLVGLLNHQKRPLLLAYRNSVPISGDFSAPLVVGLRRVGRVREADWLLQSIADDIAGVERLNYDPITFDMDRAGLAALQRRDADATRWLDRAVARGWRGQSARFGADLTDDPVFASLRGQADFEQVRARMRALVAQERRAAAPILGAIGTPRVGIANPGVD